VKLKIAITRYDGGADIDHYEVDISTDRGVTYTPVGAYSRLLVDEVTCPIDFVCILVENLLPGRNNYNFIRYHISYSI
jgi:hypothetical protein